MAESKTYKVNKSKDAMSAKAWGDVDKTALRNKIMEASNKASLVKDVYMLVEDGWEDAPSEKLKYPVMNFEGDALVYNRDGLASALGYAKKENETAVVSKIEKIYKKLGLDKEDGKEEDKKMAKEVEFAAVDIGDMWGKVWNALHDRYPDGDYGSVYRIDGIYEEGNKKFAVIHRKDEDVKYRLDFSLTEDGFELADEIVKVELEIKETDEVRKFAEPENADKFKKFEDEQNEDDDGKETEMSCDEMKAEMAKLQGDIENRDNIIMEKDKELEELRAFKQTCMEADRTKTVEGIMAKVEKFMDKADADKYRAEGMTVDFAEVDAWANKVKASVVDKVVKSETKVDFTRIGAPVDVNKKTSSVWDRI